MRRFLAPIVVLCLTFLILIPAASAKAPEVWDGSIAIGFAGGSGTADDPYQISNGAELAYLAKTVLDCEDHYIYNYDYFVLTNDIVLNDVSNWQQWGTYLDDGVTMIAPQNSWQCIGYYNINSSTDYEYCSFDGNFNGQGHTVTGMFINSQYGYQGLFGYLEYAEVLNVNVEKSYVTGGSEYVAGLVGYMDEDCVVDNCGYSGRLDGGQYSGGLVGRSHGRIMNSSVNVTATVRNFGGLLVGDVMYGKVINCSAAGSVNGSRYVGALVGYCTIGYIDNCTSSGAVVSLGTSGYSSDYAGGILGYGLQANVMGCSFSGSVNGTNCAGIVGANSGGTVKNCINTGSVTAENTAGGIVAYATGGVVMNCKNTGSITGEVVGGITATNYLSGVYDCANTGALSGTTCGGIAGSNGGSVNCCYNTGTVTASGESFGGIIGANTAQGSQLGSTTETKVSGLTRSSFYLESCCTNGSSYGESKTQAQLKSPSSYTAWDKENIWAIERGSYPELICLMSEGGGSSAIWDGSSASGFASGSGTQEDPYIITTAEQLAYLSDKVNAGETYEQSYFRLDSDIVLNDFNAKYWTMNATPWKPIGFYLKTNQGDEYTSFSGRFDGNGHTISGLYIEDSGNGMGLFGSVTSDALVENLTISDSYISGTTYVGSIVGTTFVGSDGQSTLLGCTIQNCTSRAVVRGNAYVGGVIGYSGTDAVQNCVNYSNIQGGTAVGGVVGGAYYSTTVKQCGNYGLVEGVNNTGGVVGSAAYNSTIEYNTNAGTVYGDTYTGGVLGYITTAEIHCCYNTGNVLGVDYVGGVVGQSQNANVLNSYNAGQASGVNYVGGVIGVNYSYYTSQENAVSLVQYCYNVGTLSGSGKNLAGICGLNQSIYFSSTVSVKDCYWLKTCGASTGAYNGGGDGTETISNVTAYTKAQLHVQNNYKKFDFTNIWTMEGEESYSYAELIGLPMTEQPKAEYTVRYFQEQTDGSFKVAQRDTLTGVIGESVEAEVKEYEGFVYDSASSTTTGVVQEDGTLTLDLYYLRDYCTVTFVANGNTILSYEVKYGTAAENIPAIPEKTGCDRTPPYWGATAEQLACITSDLTVNAVYTLNVYSIKFYADGSLTATRQAEHGATLTDIPEVPAKEGCTKVSPTWDVTAFSNITDDMAVNAVYVLDRFTVSLPASCEAYTVTDITGTGEAEYGASYSFSVVSTAGDEPVVRANRAKIAGVLTNGVYVYTIEDIREDKAVEVSVTADSYAVNLLQGEGYTITPKEGSNNPTLHGQSYSFTISLDEGYTESELTVFANETLLTPQNGVYTIENVTETQYVSASGVKLNEYEVSFYADGSLVASYIVEHGKALETIPSVPKKAGYDGAWDAEDFSCVTGDMTVTAVYTESPIKYGDADCNGTVNAADASAILRSLVGIESLSQQGLRNADCDGSAGVSASDASAILRWLVGLMPSLPAA